MSPDQSAKAGALRTCIATRQVLPAQDMLRFVLGPDDRVVPDLKRKLPGRGVWVRADAVALGEAERRRAFQRGFKRPGATVPPGLAVTIDELMQRDALQSLALANKAGALVVGFAKVEAAVAAGKVGALLHALDAGSDGIAKLDQAVRRAFGNAADLPKIKLFAGEQLDLALGRSNVVHAALITGGAGESFLARCRRLQLFRSGGDRTPAQVPTETERNASAAIAAEALTQ